MCIRDSSTVVSAAARTRLCRHFWTAASRTIQMYNVTTMGKDTDMGRQDTAADTMEKDRDTAAADMVTAATTKRFEKFPKIATNMILVFIIVKLF